MALHITAVKIFKSTSISHNIACNKSLQRWFPNIITKKKVTKLGLMNVYPHMAYLISWYATWLLLRPLIMIVPSIPTTILSIESFISLAKMVVFLLLLARIAPSFKRFARLAPLNPSVFMAITSRDTSTLNVLLLAWTLRISVFPFTSRTSTLTKKQNTIAPSKLSTRRY